MYRKHQMTRILEVASLIHKEPRRWTRTRLAARLQVNPATIQRYIVLLRDMGIEIVPRGKQGYEMEVVRTNFFWSVNPMVSGTRRCYVWRICSLILLSIAAPAIKQRWGWDRHDAKDPDHKINIKSTSSASVIAFSVLTEPDFRPVSISAKYAR